MSHSRMPESLVYRRLRAPRANNELFCDPDESKVPTLLAQNRRRLTRRKHDAVATSWVGGFDTVERDLEACDLHDPADWNAFRREAKRVLVTLAQIHTQRYCAEELHLPDGDVDKHALIASGHQPQLYHAGVWAKNFALDRFARQTGAIAVQINVDNDLCRLPSIRVPTGSLQRPRSTQICFDCNAPSIPFEERKMLDQASFASFPDRVCDAMRDLVSAPLVEELWSYALPAMARSGLLGQSIAEARHRLEWGWGVRTWEVPLSDLCETAVFCAFARHVLVRMEEFQTAYNDTLAIYRRVHRLRNAAQPLPDLQRRAGFYETPFWIWTKESPARRALWLGVAQDKWQFGDGEQVLAELECSSKLPGASARGMPTLDAWRELANRGIRIRPRALTTTLFLRWLATDLFIHGIGGAKYDQVTDLIAQRFWNAAVPAFVTVSATLQLPLALPDVRPAQLVELGQLERELRFHPEKFLPPSDVSKYQVSRSLFAKKSWIATELPRGARKTRHEQIEVQNAFLRGFLEEKCSTIEQSRSILVKHLETLRQLGSREWSFCLFPSADLRTRLLELWQTVP